ncbi:hypothetical protein Taro_038323, partial [Colocasia esculenta]|nr:hypothetical protein [Colocasia esculenta]
RATWLPVVQSSISESLKRTTSKSSSTRENDEMVPSSVQMLQLSFFFFYPLCV